ncbi:MAG: PBP1A family penicillin-binding protein [Thermodesulfobacteria bacterium]|nr:PBP1A family penicillin-binding protein [Thermodesulfobacteriota bacterium]
MARKNSKKNKRIWGVKPLLAIVWTSCFLVTGLAFAAMAAYMMLKLPSIASLKNYKPAMVTEVYSSDGKTIAYWYKEKRWPVSIEKIPKRLIYAFLAAEDARFYEHRGIDFVGVIRAAIRNVEAGGIVQGASTITQQVTRSLLLSPERSWIRKLKEAILAWQIDGSLSKDEILNIYLNQIYLGSGAYGVEAAARTYFNKHVEDLDIAQCALIAGLTQAPSRYNPFKHFDKARKRQLYVLRRMFEEGFITQEEREAAEKEKLHLESEKLEPPKGSEYFLQDIKKELVRRYGVKRVFTDGLKIYTTLDSRWQEKAFQAVSKGLEAVKKRHRRDKALKKNIQGALIAIDAQTGAIRAMVGGQDFKKNKFNLAIQGRMQPGSSFKPVVYSAAMKRGLIQPNSIIVDEPISFPGTKHSKPWQPQNFDRAYMGPITIRTALTYSRNVVSVKIARMVGINNVIEQARLMGITTPLAHDLSIALGSSAVPLVQMVTAYSTFVNMGEVVTPQYIEQITDRNGKIIELLTPEFHEALDPETAFQMAYLLMGVVQNGTGRRARAVGVPVGGKTGTTDNYHDAWFVGFSPEVVAGVWIGRKDKKSLGRLETGGRAACPVWTEFMKTTVKDLTKKTYDIPDGIAFVPVDKRTGQIVTPTRENQKDIIWEALRKDRLPPLAPETGFLHQIPDWLKGIGSFFHLNN